MRYKIKSTFAARLGAFIIYNDYKIVNKLSGTCRTA